MPKLKVFISSTCYDLSVIREELRNFIEELGHEPVMSDYWDVLYDPRIHTHTSCVKNVPSSDVVILLIGSRFGGTAVSEAKELVDFETLKDSSRSVAILNQPDKISITQLEILKAVEIKIPILPFVDGKVYSDHEFYENNKSESAFIKGVVKFPNIDKKETAMYIFEFINFLRHRPFNNSVFPFSKLEDIRDIIKGQLSALFQTLLFENKANVLFSGKERAPQNIYPEVYNISYSYNETDWANLLNDASVVDLCMLYTGRTWNARHSQHFIKFMEEGGRINIYLPEIKSIRNRFFRTMQPAKDVTDKIFRTINQFKEFKKKTNKGELNVKMLNEGFNYAYSRIEKKNGQKLFLMSPYPNNLDSSDTPVIIFNESHISLNMQNFINLELDFLRDSVSLPDYELEKYIVWSSNRNRVFISTGLSCPGGCKFCYVDSLVSETTEKNSTNIARVLCNTVRNDPRFKEGENGTIIMLGAFTDPFLIGNFDATVEIVDFFSLNSNPIHISARYTIGKNLPNLFSPTSNVVINYSICSMGKNIEVANQLERFEEASRLVKMGYNVTLFLRPVIKDYTINFVDEIINRAISAGINTVTIGGLYVDDRIINQLSDAGISAGNISKVMKQFVLDDRSVLTKLKIDDIEEIARKFKEKGFKTFLSSDQRIEYFKEIVSKKIK